jgi:hypothetical protein
MEGGGRERGRKGGREEGGSEGEGGRRKSMTDQKISQLIYILGPRGTD